MSASCDLLSDGQHRSSIVTVLFVYIRQGKEKNVMKKTKQIGMILILAVFFYMVLPFTVDVIEDSIRTDAADVENGIVVLSENYMTPSPKPIPEAPSDVTVLGTFCSAEKVNFSSVASPVPTEAPGASVVSMNASFSTDYTNNAIPIQIP